MATVVIQKRQRKNNVSYIVSYSDPLSGKKKYFKTFTRQKNAQKAANYLRGLIDSGRIWEIKKSKIKLNLLTFSEVSRLLKEEWQKRLESKDLRQKTFEEYVYRLGLVNRRFNKGLLCEVSKEDILTYRKEAAYEFSNVTSNRSLFIIKQIFKHGLMINAVIEDPSSDISYLSEKEHVRNKFILPAELERLIDASRKGRTKYYLPALICLGAEHGASKQEALSLRWPDIDFDYDGSGTIRFFRTKNMKERTEYLMPRTKQALIELRNHQEWMRHRKKIDSNGSELVFCHLDGSPIKSFHKAWREACNKAGIKDFHFHDLRHTFCSNLLLSGSDLKDVKEMIGHNDLSMTDRYSHLTLNYKRLQQARLAEHYANHSH